MLFRRRRRSQAHYSDYDVPDEDAEVSSFFSDAPPNDVYDMPYACDPYAAFDPDVSAASEDDNHEPAESGSAQRNFKKIGEQWGAMVTSHSADRGRSRADGDNHYNDERSARRDTFYRHKRRKNNSGLRRPAAVRSPSGHSPVRSPSGHSPESSVQEQAVVNTPQVFGSEEFQPAAEDDRLLSQAVDENCLPSHDGIVNSTASTQMVIREMVDHDVQCAPKTTDTLKKEYIR